MEIQSTQTIPTGKLLGSILLIAGCCIGAGMLGLPVLSGYAGFVPASFIFVFSCLLFGAVIYWGTQAVDWFNRILMLGLIFSYALLVVLGSRHVDSNLLQYTDWSQVTLVIPAAILSFGFHNLIPSLTSYLNGDV